MKIAIVDDSKQDAARIHAFTEEYCKLQNIQADFSRFENADRFLWDFAPGFWELVILDIDMPGINGIDCARRLREKDSKVVIMFVTNMPQYALCGYEVEAVDYCLKPVARDTFFLKLQKAFRYVRRNEETMVMIRTADELLQLPISRISYIETAFHYLIYHTADREYRVRGTISKAEEELSPHHFVRCSNSFLVNLRFVERIEKDEVIAAGEHLKMSRGRKNDFINSFTRYLGGL